MDNPFDTILHEISSLKELIAGARNAANDPIEIIDRKELQKRLGVTEPTIIRWVRKGRIPEITIGTTCRYNWLNVVQTLENAKTETT